MFEKTISRKEFEELKNAHTGLENLVIKIVEHDIGSCEKNKRLTSRQIDILDVLVKYIVYIVRILQILFFIQMFVITDIYLSENLRQALLTLIKSFAGLSEGWKIMIVGLILGVPTAIVTQVLGWLALKQIEKILEKAAKNPSNPFKIP